jgi:hypothetical protein
MGTVRYSDPSAAARLNHVQSTKTTLVDVNGFGSWRPIPESRPPGLPFKPALQSIWQNSPPAQKPNGTQIGSSPLVCSLVANRAGLSSLSRDRAEPKPHPPADSFERSDQSQWAKFEPDPADHVRLAVGPPSRAPATQSPKPPQSDFPSMASRQNAYQVPSGFGAHRQGLMGSAPKFAPSFAEPRIRDITDGRWEDAPPVQSMADAYLQPSSAGASRNGSLPPSRSGNEPFSFNGVPKYHSRPSSGVSNVPTPASRRSSDDAVSPARVVENGHDPRRGQPSPRYELGQQYGDPQSLDDVVPTEHMRDITLQPWNGREPSPTDDRYSPHMVRNPQHGASQYSVVRHQDYSWPNRVDRRPSHAQPTPDYISHQQFQHFQMLMNQMQYQQQFTQYMPQQIYYPPVIPMQIPMPLPQIPMPAPTNRTYEPGVPVQSQLLREFKTGTKRDRRWELKDIYGHVVEFAGDTTGSRFLQGKLETANSDEKGYIFAEIFPNCLPLMRDVFGNYVIQKVFEHGDQKQKAMLADQMKTRVYELSNNMYACRVVQKAFDHILDDQRAMLVSELSKPGLVLGCCESLHGNHVIQKAIEVIPKQHIGFIYDELLDRVPKFADHTYGCRIVQRMLEQPDQGIRDQVLAQLYRVGVPALISSTYGNYVAQHVMEHGGDEGREWIFGVVVKDIRTYGRHKFASNVVEKCIEFGTVAQRKAILAAVLEYEAASKLPGGDSDDGVMGFIKCGFGNYVIRKSTVSRKAKLMPFRETAHVSARPGLRPAPQPRAAVPSRGAPDRQQEGRRRHRGQAPPPRQLSQRPPPDAADDRDGPRGRRRRLPPAGARARAADRAADRVRHAQQRRHAVAAAPTAGGDDAQGVVGRGDGAAAADATAACASGAAVAADGGGRGRRGQVAERDPRLNGFRRSRSRLFIGLPRFDNVLIHCWHIYDSPKNRHDLRVLRHIIPETL